MEVYDVTSWDVSLTDDPEGWVMESSPISEQAIDSFMAARQVAKRANSRVKLEGVRRPEGSSDVFFKDPELDIVYQVSDTFSVKSKDYLRGG